jgi:hypothetical protein
VTPWSLPTSRRASAGVQRRRLDNFAAHVLRVADGRVTEWRMADAKPAESDRFWA